MTSQVARSKVLKRVLIVAGTVALFCTFARSQTDEPQFYTIVENMPRFRGCENAGSETEAKECTRQKIGAYLLSMKYPDEAVNQKLQGKAYVRFIVGKDGTIEQPEIAMSSGHELLDRTALDHIKNMPVWLPGKQQGKPVRVQYVVPFSFSLGEAPPLPEAPGRRIKKQKKKSK